MRVALIGLGNIGKIHLNAIKECDVTLVGICDIDKSKLEIIDKELRFTDYKKMINTAKPDIVHICTPHYLHKEMIIYSLMNNVHVFCEKPLCISKKEIDEIDEVISKSNKQLGVCYQNRYNPSTIFTKEYLKDKNVLSIEGELKWCRNKNYYNQSYWRGKKEYEGGGVLINQAIHTIDLMQYFYKVPEEIIAKIENKSLKGIIDVEDNAEINSINNDFKITASNSYDQDYPIKIIIKTKEEKIIIDSNRVIINEKIYECEKLSLLESSKEIYGGGHLCIIKDFYYCVRNQIKFNIDFKESVKSLKIVLASYESNERKIKVK